MTNGLTQNTLLIRYDEGHVDIDQSGVNDRIEGYLQLANVRTEEGALSFGRQRLARLRDDLRTVAFSGKLRAAQQALGIGFHMGDRFDGSMIASVQIEQDANGVITITPEVDSPVEIAEAALQRKIDLIAAGITSEYANPNTDRQGEGTGTDTTPPPFSMPGELTSGFSPIWKAPRPFWWSWAECVLETAGSTPTLVQLHRVIPGGTSVMRSAVIAPGDRRLVEPWNVGIPVGQEVLLVVPTIGVGAEGLTVTPRGTMV